MNLLSNAVIAFVPRRLPAAAVLRAVASTTTIPADIACHWQRDRVTGRLNCVWTSLEAGADAEAQPYLCLAS